MTTWRIEITKCMSSNDDCWEDIVSCTLTDNKLDTQFDDSCGGKNGAPFTVWTKECVYFPVERDGSEWCESVPRNPNNEVTNHI